MRHLITAVIASLLIIAACSLCGCQSIGNAIGRAIGNQIVERVDKLEGLTADQGKAITAVQNFAEKKFGDYEQALTGVNKMLGAITGTTPDKVTNYKDFIPQWYTAALEPLVKHTADNMANTAGKPFPTFAIISFIVLGALVGGVLWWLLKGVTLVPSLIAFGSGAAVAMLIAIAHYRVEIEKGGIIIGIVLAGIALLAGVAYLIIRMRKNLQSVVAGVETAKTALGDAGVPYAMIPKEMLDDLKLSDVVTDSKGDKTVPFSVIMGIAQDKHQDAATQKEVAAIKVKLGK